MSGLSLSRETPLHRASLSGCSLSLTPSVPLHRQCPEAWCPSQPDGRTQWQWSLAGAPGSLQAGQLPSGLGFRTPSVYAGQEDPTAAHEDRQLLARRQTAAR